MSIALFVLAVFRENFWVLKDYKVVMAICRGCYNCGADSIVIYPFDAAGERV
jgi:hypothetical protein